MSAREFKVDQEVVFLNVDKFIVQKGIILNITGWSWLRISGGVGYFSPDWVANADNWEEDEVFVNYILYRAGGVFEHADKVRTLVNSLGIVE